MSMSGARVCRVCAGAGRPGEQLANWANGLRTAARAEKNHEIQGSGGNGLFCRPEKVRTCTFAISIAFCVSREANNFTI